MIIYNFLDYVFVSPSIIKVIRVLNERVTAISGRETARLALITHRSALKALTTLESFKIVKRQVGGRDHLFTLNRENYIVSELLSVMLDSEKEFVNRIFSLIKRRLGKVTESIIVFGSVARKEETVTSDLDICIIYKGNKKEIEILANIVFNTLNKKFAVTLAPLYLSEREFRKRAKRNDSPVNSILKEGKVISGKSIKKLING
ncbi:nucleotidyltransferase domain protein [bacterium BMS3Abin04]|nr:nucleotidyltransferase domain protein [bacterium BMS3Abin04]